MHRKYTDAPPLLDRIRALAKSDRDLYEKGNLAFVSFIRAYKEHQVNGTYRREGRRRRRGWIEG